MKCQKCTKAATLHITEIVTEEQIEELHLVRRVRAEIPLRAASRIERREAVRAGLRG